MDKTAFPGIMLIGLGGIGTPLLPVLAKLQPPHVRLYDDDRVEPENLQTQFWSRHDVGQYKAAAAASWLYERGVHAIDTAERYVAERHVVVDPIVIAAVDSLESRREIWRGVRESGNAKLLIDGRLSRDAPHFAQLFIIPTENARLCSYYEEWLEGVGEPDSGRRDLDMIPAPVMLSGLIATILVRWHREERLPWQVVWDGMSMSLMPSFEEE